MAMPKKSLRKIVVDGKTYRYKIHCNVDAGLSSSGTHTFVVEIDGKYHYGRHARPGTIGPKVIEAFIKERLKEK